MIALGAAHTVSITVERVPGSIHTHLSPTARTTIDSMIDSMINSMIMVLLQTPVTVALSGTSSLVASIQADSFATSGTVSRG